MVDRLSALEIGAWRREAEQTQEEFAKMLGLSRATIARWEAGTDQVPLWASYARAGWLADPQQNPIYIKEGPATDDTLEARILAKVDDKLVKAFPVLRDQLVKAISERVLATLSANADEAAPKLDTK